MIRTRTINYRPFISFMLICMGFLLAHLPVHADQSINGSWAAVLRINGAIGPGVADYVVRGIETAQKQGASAVVLTMDTPGGLATAMRRMIKSILSADIPVIGYVTPSGARAASAGTYLLYASHIAAMAPGTNLGAATPVSIGAPSGIGGQDKDKDKNNKKNKKKNQPKVSATNLKAINDAKAYIKSLAELRGRNVKWAVKAVTEADSISANEALKKNVINVIAVSIPALLNKINDQSVIIDGKSVVLKTTNLALKPIHPTWRDKILAVITNPSVAYILMMLGVYGLFFEFMNPGFIVPGVVGGISLLVALYAFQMLPINYAGVILIVLGLVFMIAEVFVPSFGALGLGGIIGFLIGSFLLMDTDVPGFSLPWQLIIGVTISTALFIIGAIQLIVRSRNKPVVSGQEGMIGKVGTIEKVGKQTWVIVSGERWHVKSDENLKNDQQVKVIATEGMVLKVSKLV